MISDFLFHLLIPTTKLGFALWGIVLFAVGLLAAALLLGWVILT